MASAGDQNSEDASIRPVSSLLSHFESIAARGPSSSGPSRTHSPSLRPQIDKLEEPPSRSLGRISLDLPRPQSQLWINGAPTGLHSPAEPHARRSPSPGSARRPRPMSMGPASPPRPTPKVTVDSPRSPPKFLDGKPPPPPPAAVQRSLFNGSFTPTGSASQSPIHSARHSRAGSRVGTPITDLRPSPLLPPTDSHSGIRTPRLGSGEGSPNQAPPIPPPVNRAEKPKIPPKPPTIPLKPKPTNLKLSPTAAPTAPEEPVSPFSTPPESETEAEQTPPFQRRTRSQDTGSKPKRDSYFDPTQVRPSARHSIQLDRASRPPPPPPAPRSPGRSGLTNLDAHPLPPSRPARHPSREGRSAVPPPPPSLPPRRDFGSQDASPGRPTSQLALPTPSPPASVASKTAATLVAETTAKFPPPPRRGTAPIIPPTSAFVDQETPLREGYRSASNTSLDLKQAYRYDDVYDSDETGAVIDYVTPTLTDYPDSSHANRRWPCFKHGPREFPTKYETRLFDICGEYLCTSGFLTKVWNILTGELLMSVSHGETTKVTALAFKTGVDLRNEGKRLWLGTNHGEIQEMDISTQTIVFSKANAHPRRELVKIYRHGSEMWSLDDEGKLLLWPSDETGSPNLGYSPLTFRVPKGHTFSLVIGDQLWLATGKDLRIFQPSADSSLQFQVLQRPLNQPNVGDVTSGSVIMSQPDRVYFGHNDGKVTVYSRKDYSCLGVVNVSLYKINSLAGVGAYLWAGYNTGMIYVYDTTTNPWTVKKDWQAHENPVAGIVVDRSAVMKIDRLQVASLGGDNMARLWDGLLQEDWLEADMQEHDTEFCNFREISALVVTWNAGATKPSSLNQDERDADFFRRLLQNGDPPDLLVFGFQELVDLEDKKITAKSFFKTSSKKKDIDHEHISRQYRAWRDHLSRCVEEFMPIDQPYHLLHTASLVGLFTCVFVKASERNNIRSVDASEVKRGMGGLHGNKGALIMRFIIDDSSVCLVNCHLAAGQKHTVQRNNDIAAILETASLPSERNPIARSDMFVGGGDGTMVLDHEICILNGDLNYRIDTMGRDTVVSAVKANNLSKLLDRDQLLLSRRRNPGFRLRAFTECPITFAPTYKYDVGTDNYDTSEKRRSPAWCDRLLYRGLGRIKQMDYRRHEVYASDHRPVSGRFQIRIKTISPKRRMQIWELCEQRFEEVKQRLVTETQLEFLVDVCRLDVNEAKRSLAEQLGR
ncbi:DNase I-like protein [Xylona heveae TC161]|uniref:DNase I-like protein n=1 Tax=Xylona heveae (strain CBS 132557 / TC161) TaxID=1328760 RepID=A0A165AEW7_XYLHT|nr:DNase I-like protein [Xylona heveae TC161]KZF20363.1 DNase I-like protein [Xylona heveae TC161]